MSALMPPDARILCATMHSTTDSTSVSSCAAMRVAFASEIRKPTVMGCLVSSIRAKRCVFFAQWL